MKRDVEQRKKQLIEVIGKWRLEKAAAFIKAYEDTASHIVEEHKWYAILKALDKTKDPSVLLPLLKVPAKVRPQFEDALKRRLMLCHRPGQGNTIPSYLPMSEPEAVARYAARYVGYLVALGAPKDEAIEYTTLIFEEVTDDKLRDVLLDKDSSVRNLKARRARARGTAE
jgi:hypothetical protein